MKIMRQIWFHWRGLSAAIQVKLDRYRFNGVTLTGFLLLLLFFVGLPWMILPFQTLKPGPTFVATLLNFNWIGFIFGLWAIVQLFVFLDSMVKEGVIFNAERKQLSSRGDVSNVTDEATDIEALPIGVYGQLRQCRL
jgi:hypothetical protein